MHKTDNDVAYMIKAVLLVVLVAVLCILVWHDLPPEWLDPRWVESCIKNLGVLAPLAYILLRTIAIVLTVVSLQQQILLGLALVALLLALPVWIRRNKPAWLDNGSKEADPPESEL